METAQPSQARILVIDDEEVIHTSLSRLLGRQGHEVISVLDAQEGLKRMINEDFDMVITDLMMPEMNGIELLEQMSELAVKIPVLMITGYPTIRTAMQALRLGAVDYVAKPFRRQELLGPVNRILRRSQQTDLNEPEIVYKVKSSDQRYVLADHSWAIFLQDGTAQIGIEHSFLKSIGQITKVRLPQEADLIEQGYTGISVETSAGEHHGVFMPLSGQVVAINNQVEADPSTLTYDMWLLQVIPSHYETERDYLKAQ